MRDFERVVFGSVSPDPSWSSRPVFIIGGGPSLTGRDLSGLRDRGWVLGVNRAADEVPCDASFTMDAPFANRRQLDLEKWSESQEVYFAVPLDHPRPRIPGVIYLNRLMEDGCSKDPKEVRNGLNSGHGAIQCAILKGAREIFLLGFDLVDPGPGPVHWHSGHGNRASRNAIVHWPKWMPKFQQIADQKPEGVEIFNANPESAIRSFPFKSYEELGL